MYRGWYQIAYEHELAGELTATAVGPTPLVVGRTPAGARGHLAA